MSNGKSRTDWVDYAKAIGIILVVYGHVARGLVKAGIVDNSGTIRLIDSFIYSFHMPLFFFLSGLFFLPSLQRRGRVSLVCNKVDTIIYPYLVWSLIQGSIEVALSRYTNGNIGWEDLTRILIEPRAQFWFLYALFLIFIIATLTYRNSSNVLSRLILVGAGSAYLLQSSFDEPIQLTYILNNFVFFAAGVQFSNLKQPVRTGNAAALIVGFFAIWTTVYLTQGSIITAGGSLSLLLGLSGIGAAVGASVILTRYARSSTLALIGTMSMQIFLMHIIAGSGTRVVLVKFFGIYDPSIHLLTGTLAGVLIPMAITVALNRAQIQFLFTPPRPLQFDRSRGAERQP